MGYSRSGKPGDRYVERVAGAELECQTCEGPIYHDELYCALVGKPNWILCCRCTFVY